MDPVKMLLQQMRDMDLTQAELEKIMSKTKKHDTPAGVVLHTAAQTRLLEMTFGDESC